MVSASAGSVTVGHGINSRAGIGGREHFARKAAERKAKAMRLEAEQRAKRKAERKQLKADRRKRKDRQRQADRQ